MNRFLLLAGVGQQSILQAGPRIIRRLVDGRWSMVMVHLPKDLLRSQTEMTCPAQIIIKAVSPRDTAVMRPVDIRVSRVQGPFKIRPSPFLKLISSAEPVLKVGVGNNRSNRLFLVTQRVL